VTDEEILDAYRLLAGRDGVFCEPASAASVAGLLKLSREKRLPDGAMVVATLTGHGLKDPERAIASSGPVTVVEADSAALEREVRTS
jgi:threonine synthase